MQRAEKNLTPAVFAGVALLAAAAWGGPATDQVRQSVDRVLTIAQDTTLRAPANGPH
jgi:hypothetical protein